MGVFSEDAGSEGVIAAVRARHGGARWTEEEGVVLKARVVRAGARAAGAGGDGALIAAAGDALAELAAHWAAHGEWREAREGLQEALARYGAAEAAGFRVDGVKRGRAWEGLAACYLEEGASVSALGALEEALACEGLPERSRTYCLAQRGGCFLAAGQLDQALEAFADALEASPQSSAALCGTAAVLVRRAEAGRGDRGSDGTLARALRDARAAAGVARAAAALHPGMLAPWKLLGDAQTLVAALAPAAEAAGARRDAAAAADLSQGRQRAARVAREAEAEARHAYNVLRTLPDSPYADGRALDWPLPGVEEGADATVGSGVPESPDALQKLAEANLWNSLLHTHRFEEEVQGGGGAPGGEAAEEGGDREECEGDGEEEEDWEPEFVEGIRESEAERKVPENASARGAWTDAIGRENPHLGRARVAAEAAAFFGTRAASLDPWDARRWLAEAAAKAVAGDAEGAAAAARAALGSPECV